MKLKSIFCVLFAFALQVGVMSGKAYPDMPKKESADLCFKQIKSAVTFNDFELTGLENNHVADLSCGSFNFIESNFTKSDLHLKIYRECKTINALFIDNYLKQSTESKQLIKFKRQKRNC